MDQHINTLKTLTAQLVPSLGDIAQLVGTVRVYMVQAGHMVGIGLYYGSDIAVARIMAVAGTELPPHRHATQHEWLGVIKGGCKITFTDEEGKDEESVDLMVGESVHIIPGRGHRCSYFQDTTLWALSMPPADGFPPPGCP